MCSLSCCASAVSFSLNFRFFETGSGNNTRLSTRFDSTASVPSSKSLSFEGLCPRRSAVRRLPKRCVVGLLLRRPLDRPASFSSPSCVGVGGRSGSSYSSLTAAGFQSPLRSFPPVALPNSSANWSSGVFVASASSPSPFIPVGDGNAKSEGPILLETRLGGTANACRRLDFRLDSDAGDGFSWLGLSSGLAVEGNEGRRAFRSRKPSIFGPDWISRSVEFGLLGDLREFDGDALSPGP